MLEAIELTCERGDVRLFAGLSFLLGQGGLLRVQGVNGSGKTSLLRMLAGLSRPAAGTIRWRGEDIRHLQEVHARDVLYLGHMNALKDEFSADENLEVAMRLAGRDTSRKERADALSRFGLAARMSLPVRYLSQGQKRRAALARLCLAGEVPLWILDEPFAALDVRAVQAVAEVAASHRARGGCVILTTHQEVAVAGAEPTIVTLGAREP